VLIELQNIHKDFGRVKAVNGASLTIRPGEIHGILGENGAGKSTLMKVLSGVCRESAGTIRIDGTPVNLFPPEKAASVGIGMLYQDPLDFPPLSVLENYCLGNSTTGFGATGRNETRFLEQAGRLGFQLNPRHRLNTLTLGERQQVEILRLLSLGAETLILDEPTAGLSLPQKRTLFQSLKTLAADGKSILFVSHKIAEAESLCDSITVLRRGVVIGSAAKPFETARLLSMVFGSARSMPSRKQRVAGNTVLEMAGIYGRGGRSGLIECSQSLRHGEIVGLAGLSGSARGLFLRIAAGLQPPDMGQVRLKGRTVTGKGPDVFRQEGVAFLPAGRLEEGLVPGLDITEHLMLQNAAGAAVLDRRQARKNALGKLRAFHIPAEPDWCVETLSGGNQQRLLLSLLPETPDLLLLEHPTRGLDMDAAGWVWQHLQTVCGDGAGIAFSSSDLDELLQFSDRILVFYNGRLLANRPAQDLNAQRLGQAIAGAL